MTKVKLINIEHLKKSYSIAVKDSLPILKSSKKLLKSYEEIKSNLNNSETRNYLTKKEKNTVLEDQQTFKKKLSQELKNAILNKKKEINRSLNLLKSKKNIEKTSSKLIRKNTGFI